MFLQKASTECLQQAAKGERREQETVTPPSGSSWSNKDTDENKWL